MEQELVNPGNEFEKTNSAAASETPDVLVIPRVLFNYAVIALTFLIVGFVIGVVVMRQPASSQTAALSEADIEQTIRRVLSEVSLSGGASAADTNVRFDLVDNDPYIGPEDAPVVIVEFSDFRCPYCGRHFEQTLGPLLENYGQFIRYVYRDFPGLGQESLNAALAAECANAQGKFWEFHTDLFSRQGEISRELYFQLAETYELDLDAFTECVDTEQYLNDVETDYFDGQLEGVQGTPGFFINGTFIRGAQPYQIFERVVQRELTRAGIDWTQPAEVEEGSSS